MKRFFFATQNKGKQQEMRDFFADVDDVTSVFPEDIPGLEELDPDETGQTLEENAQIKAEAFLLGLERVQAEPLPDLVIAEDSGLEVTALDGKPGVHSKRFFPGSDADRNAELLRLLQNKSDRSAQFRTVLWVIDTKSKSATSYQGIVTGQIADKSSGSNGFGFDPIFIPDGHQTTFAELGQEIKNSISHRARALAAFKNKSMV